MATVAKSWTFASDLEGWTTANTSDVTASRNASGWLQAVLATGRNKAGTATFTYQGTWQSLGVPAGQLVTHVQLSLSRRVPAFATVDSCSWGATLQDGSGGALATALGTQTETALDNVWDPVAGATAQLSAAQASSATMRLVLSTVQDTGNSASASCTLEFDALTLTVTYEPATTVHEAAVSLAGEPGALAVSAEVGDPLSPQSFGMEGFGANTTGGDLGTVLHVTRLADDSNEGSLRWALTQTYPRKVVFDVAGDIALNTYIRITSGELTVDGSTAPHGGVCLKNAGGCQHPLLILAASDIKLLYLRDRPGPASVATASLDCLQLGDTGYTVRRILVDHCSLTLGTDENLSGFNDTASPTCEDVTIQYSIIGWGLHNASYHTDGAHGFGLIMGRGMSRWSIHHCLLALCDQRLPLIKAGTFDLRNNIIYAWNTSASYIRSEDGACQGNIVNNYYKKSSQITTSAKEVAVQKDGNALSLYIAGNLGPSRPTGTEDEWAGTWGVSGTVPTDWKTTTPIAVEPVTTQSAADAYATVLAEAGAILPYRDAMDQALIDHVAAGSGTLVTTVAEAGGYPDLTQDQTPPSGGGVTLSSDFDATDGTDLTALGWTAWRGVMQAQSGKAVATTLEAAGANLLPADAAEISSAAAVGSEDYDTWGGYQEATVTRVDSASDPGASSGGADPYALKVAYGSAANPNAAVAVGLIHDRRYQLSGRIYVPAGSGQAKLTVLSPTFSERPAAATLATTGAWTEVTGPLFDASLYPSYSEPDKRKHHVAAYCYSASGDLAYFDQVRLEEWLALYVQDAGAADHSIEATVTVGTQVSSDLPPCGLVLRGVNATNYWMARLIRSDGYYPSLCLERVENGIRTEVATATPTITQGVPVVVKAEVEGDAFTVSVGGTPVLSYTDPVGVHQAGTYAGLLDHYTGLNAFDAVTISGAGEPTVHEAAATLAGEPGTLSVAGQAEPSSTVALSGSAGTVTVAGQPEISGAVALSGSAGMITASGQAQPFGALALAGGSGGLLVEGEPEPAGSVVLAGEPGTVVLAGEPEHRAVVSLAGEPGALAAAASTGTLFTAAHEAGDWSEWDGHTLDAHLELSAAAALAGSAYGIAVTPNGTSQYYAEADLSWPAGSDVLRARFYLDPQSIATSGNISCRVFALQGSNDYQYAAFVYFGTDGGQYYVGTMLHDDGGTIRVRNKVFITDAPHRVEILLQRASSAVAADGGLWLWVDGVAADSVAGQIDNYDSAAAIQYLRFGLVTCVTGFTGTFSLDELVVTDTAVEIGPAEYAPEPTIHEAELALVGAAGELTISGHAEPSSSLALLGEPGALLAVGEPEHRAVVTLAGQPGALIVLGEGEGAVVATVVLAGGLGLLGVEGHTEQLAVVALVGAAGGLAVAGQGETSGQAELAGAAGMLAVAGQPEPSGALEAVGAPGQIGAVGWPLAAGTLQLAGLVGEITASGQGENAAAVALAGEPGLLDVRGLVELAVLVALVGAVGEIATAGETRLPDPVPLTLAVRSLALTLEGRSGRWTLRRRGWGWTLEEKT